MNIEHWSLLIAVLALISSIALPLWFRSKDAEEKISEKRSLLLQKILSLKSLSYSSRIQLVYMLKRFGEQMDEDQRNTLNAQLENLQEHENKIWALHDECSNYEDGASLADLDEILKNVAVAESEAVDTADLIEKGMKSYE